MSYTDAIINLNAFLIGSNLSSDYILFEEKDNKYNHLCIAQDSRGKRYAESFFVNPTDLYMRGQAIVPMSIARMNKELTITRSEQLHLSFRNI